MSWATATASSQRLGFTLRSLHAVCPSSAAASYRAQSRQSTVVLSTILALAPHLGARQMNTAPTGAPTLDFQGGAFVVAAGGRTARVPAAEPAETVRDVVAFRKNDRYVVWDGRGLTVRTERGTLSTRFAELAVSPRLFGKDLIRANLAAFRAGARRKEADALSGAVRIGSGVYLLPRWTDAKGGTWLEALVRVDLDDDAPKPRLLGRFAGTTLAYRPVDDALKVTDSRPVAIVRGASSGAGVSWGIAACLPVAREFGYIPLGTDLRWVVGSSYAERTAYGTTLVGTVDRRGMARTMRLETRADPVTPVGPEGRIVTFERASEAGADTTVVADARTGAQLALPGSLSARAVALAGRGPLVVLFDDAARPTRAWLVGSGAGLAILARWTAPASVAVDGPH